MNARRRHLMTLLKAFDLVVVVASMLFAAVVTLPEFARNDWFSVFEVRLSLANTVGVALYLVAWHVALTTRGSTTPTGSRARCGRSPTWRSPRCSAWRRSH